jgi:hypothetical protein
VIGGMGDIVTQLNELPHNYSYFDYIKYTNGVAANILQNNNDYKPVIEKLIEQATETEIPTFTLKTKCPTPNDAELNFSSYIKLPKYFVGRSHSIFIAARHTEICACVKMCGRNVDFTNEPALLLQRISKLNT